jgi:nucleoside-diphosphate-sugar epimerase
VIDPLAEYRKVNVEGTRNLALQAAKAGVKRFIFMSSIKVNGESTRSGHPFTVDAPPAPDDPYGISKWEAEQALQHVVEQTGLQAVIIRPPLVYGPGVGANFRRLMDLSGSGLPLPLGSIKNLRSLVYVGNLCDLISKCLVHPAAIGQTFLVSDDRDISVPDLLLLLSVALHKKVRLVPMPVGILKLAGYLTGRTAEVERLCCSLQVDISKTKELLGWTPPFTIEQGILETVKTRMMTDDFTPAKERKHSNGS